MNRGQRLWRRRAVWGGIGLLAVLAIGICWRFIHTGSGHYPVSRHVHWHLVVRNQSNQALRDVKVYSFVPRERTWQQALLGLSANYPVTVDAEQDGHPIGRLELATIPPFGQREVRISAELGMADHHANSESTNFERLLEPEPLIESDRAPVTSLARRLHRDDARHSARAIYDWLVTEVAYDGYDPVDRGALHAMEQRSGDCTEYAALAVALARAMGIPARLANGYVMEESGRLDPFGFHAWAEIRIDARWLILDGQERKFDPSPHHYLVTHYGTSASRHLAWTRFHSPESRVEIEMR